MSTIEKEDDYENLIQQVFDSIDNNNNGFISSQEMRIALDKIAKSCNQTIPTNKELSEFLQHLDLEYDGRITYKEFKDNLRKILIETKASG